MLPMDYLPQHLIISLDTIKYMTTVAIPTALTVKQIDLTASFFAAVNVYKASTKIDNKNMLIFYNWL